MAAKPVTRTLKPAPEVKAEEIAAAPEKIWNPGGPLCDCGEPVAVGQSSVCAKHIRRG